MEDETAELRELSRVVFGLKKKRFFFFGKRF